MIRAVKGKIIHFQHNGKRMKGTLSDWNSSQDIATIKTTSGNVDVHYSNFLSSTSKGSVPNPPRRRKAT